MAVVGPTAEALTLNAHTATNSKLLVLGGAPIISGATLTCLQTIDYNEMFVALINAPLPLTRYSN